MTAHKHAALMLQYAQDAAETDKPWLLWEIQNPRVADPQFWSHCQTHPEWNPDLDYRRKPRTIRIGEFEVPEPLRVAPPKGTQYCTFSLSAPRQDHQAFYWADDEFDHRLLALGLIHLTREAAEQHARALLAFTK